MTPRALRRAVSPLIGAVALVVSGCGSGHPAVSASDSGVESHPTQNGADGPDADVAVATSSVGPAGGTVTGPAATAITVPAGALAASTTIGVAELPVSGGPNDGMPALPARVRPVGDTFALTPHGTTFAAPVTVHLTFDPALAAQAKGRALKLFSAAPGGSWAAVPNARVGATTVDADVMHFSFFVVGFETTEQTLPAAAIGKLDMLFMIDDSTSMQPLQNKLLASFPTLIQTLQALPGGLPDLHIGVVSSSMGAGPYDIAEIQGCPHGGDAGRLHWMPTGTCVAGGGPTDHFISTGPAETAKNYPGSIADAFTCIAALGSRGCGFEHQLESMAVALGARGQAAPPENAGFLRGDAALALVMITNEDDCSAPPDATVFDPSSHLVSDPLGPLNSYRCNEFGHLCAGAKPPRTSPDGGTETLTDCHSAEDGVLVRVSDYVKAFKALKTDPTQVFITAIAAPPTPYAVNFNQGILPDPEPWPAVAHSCTSTSGDYGDPAVRISDLVAAFGANGSLSSICDDFAPALTGLGAALTRSMGPRCLQADVVDSSAAPRLLAGCGVLESVPAAGGMRTETALPACAAAVTAPCWTIKANAACAAPGAELAITRAGAAPAGAVLVVRCGP